MIRPFSRMLIAAMLVVLVGTHASAQSVRKVMNPYQEGGFEAGVSFLLKRSHYTNSADLEERLAVLFDQLVELRVNALSVVWLIYTGKVNSNKLYKNEKEDTPSNEHLDLVVRKALERGFLVTMRPIIDERIMMGKNKDWRGTIRPTNVDAWFESYTSLFLEYADLGQAAGVQIFVIGVELNSMEKYTARWRDLIVAMRERFKGKLIYSSNQGISGTMPWSDLDAVGIDAFFELDTPAGRTATVEDMLVPLRRWAGWLEGRIKSLQVTGPIILTEIGSRSEKNAHKETWLWRHHTTLDLEDQRRFYEASCLAWRPLVQGLYWWNVTLVPTSSPDDDRDFTPLGKPAEEEILRCYSK